MMTVGLIDNYAIIRFGLVFFLNENLPDSRLFDSDSLNNFVRDNSDKKFDVLILGNNSHDRKESCEKIAFLKGQFPEIPIIVYDDNFKLDVTVQYFEMGINAYVSKSNVASEIVNAINSVLNRKQFVCPAILGRLLRFETKISIDPNRKQLLTVRETEIALYLSQGMKTSWIANTLDRKPSTISTIKSTIFKKMNVENVIQLRTRFGSKDSQYNIN